MGTTGQLSLVTRSLSIEHDALIMPAIWQEYHGTGWVLTASVVSGADGVKVERRNYRRFYGGGGNWQPAAVRQNSSILSP